MKVLVIGKKGSMTNWVEEALDGFSASGHETQYCATRIALINKHIEKLFWPGIAAGIKRRIAKFDPDLILAICPERMEPTMLASIASLPNRPPLVGWIGHVIVSEQAPILNLFDALGYTDTAFIEQHRTFGLAPTAAFIPHAADLELTGKGQIGEPSMKLVFVGGACDYRRSIISQIEKPVALYGPAWADRSGVEVHDVVGRRIHRRELGKVYSRYVGVLNIRNEGLVISGLNQRHFTPLALGLLSVTDAQKDLPLCFELGREVLVYENADQLNDLYEEVRRSLGWAKELAGRGRERVLSDHTYGKRLESFGALVGVTQHQHRARSEKSRKASPQTLSTTAENG